VSAAPKLIAAIEKARTLTEPVSRPTLAPAACALCGGLGTLQTDDAARPGSTFTDICPRCGGSGFAARRFPL